MQSRQFEFEGNTLLVFFGKVAEGREEDAWISLEELADCLDYKHVDVLELMLPENCILPGKYEKRTHVGGVVLAITYCKNAQLSQRFRAKFFGEFLPSLFRDGYTPPHKRGAAASGDNVVPIRTGVRDLETIRNEFLLSMSNTVEEHEHLIQDTRNEMTLVKASVNHQDGQLSIKGWCRLRGVNVNNQEASKLGIYASAVLRRNGIEPNRMRNSEFGNINTYPEKFLNEVLPEFMRQNFHYLYVRLKPVR